MGMDHETQGKAEMDITAFWPGFAVQKSLDDMTEKRDRLEKQSKDRTQALSEELNHKIVSLSSFTEQLREAQDSLKISQSEKDRLHGVVIILEQGKARLEEELARTSIQLTTARDQLHQLEGEKQILSSKLSLLQANLV